jgi:hypothetical protein
MPTPHEPGNCISQTSGVCVWEGGGGEKNMATEKKRDPNSCRQKNDNITANGKKVTISQPTEQK